MSQVMDILTNIANLPVMVDGQVVTAYNVDDTIQQVVQTPIRIVFPLSGDNKGQSGTPRSLGSKPLTTIAWNFQDLFLYQSVLDGSGLIYALPKLVEYSSEYIKALQSNIDLGLNHVYITSFEPDFGVYEFPADSGEHYFGCTFSLTVQENIQ